jgi:subtilisin-like proprotein convertase family protein
MKSHLFIGLLALGAVMSASAGVIYSSGALNTSILDGNPNGVASQITVSGAGNVLSDVTVTLNVSGGYNGDLYAYLSYNGTLVTLLNRVGTGSGDPIQNSFGFSTAGLNNVTLDDAGTGGNIHNVQNPGSSVSYTPDGGSLASFNGLNPNGTWTLFFGDLSAGDQSTLGVWSLDITAVPEPVNVALAIFGGLMAVWHMGRWRLSTLRIKAGRRPATI